MKDFIVRGVRFVGWYVGIPRFRLRFCICVHARARRLAGTYTYTRIYAYTYSSYMLYMARWQRYSNRK